MSDLDILKEWGWDSHFSSQWEKSQVDRAVIPGRVVRQDRGLYKVIISQGEEFATISCSLEGKYLAQCQNTGSFPGVGDWVVIARVEEEKGLICGLLDRKTVIKRHNPGREAVSQVMAANIDTVFIVMALDGGRNFLLPLLERCIVAGYESGANPVILLNKADLTADEILEEARIQAENVSFGLEVYPISAKTGFGLDQVAEYLVPGTTSCFLGKSGVGKTALLNALGRKDGLSDLGREGAVSSREYKGRHTTVSRELFRLPGGGMVIDLPGLKELGLWGEDSSLEETYPEIAELSASCRFRDCTHKGEPGCAVLEALSSGALDARRYESYLELQRELAYMARRADLRARQEEARKWKQINKEMRHFSKEKRI